ncbi:CDP-alcohol phosphatidyltransferase family protein [Saccharothrix sp. 6-C]|nr:CDP-alcohol phosphatidyltransferase family protein [Saccharothrix sp. 6-C]
MPNTLAAIRLIAGPLYLAWGSLPAEPLELVILIAIGATDLVDGRLARAWGTTSLLGRYLDPLADRTFIACVLIKLVTHGILTWWLFWLIIVQYLLLSVLFLAYHKIVGNPPPPDFWARLGAGLAAVGGAIALSGLLPLLANLLLYLFAATNLAYLMAVTRRMMLRPERKVSVD